MFKFQNWFNKYKFNGFSWIGVLFVLQIVLNGQIVFRFFINMTDENDFLPYLTNNKDTDLTKFENLLTKSSLRTMI